MLGVPFSEVLPSDFTAHLRNDVSPEDSLAAEERIISWVFRRKRHRCGIERNQFLIDVEVFEDHPFRTLGGLVTIKKQSHGAADLDEHRRWLVTTPHTNLDFLHATAGSHSFLCLRFWTEEKPELSADQRHTEYDDNYIVHGYAG